ncbi:MAG: UDP-glucose 4-epimerase GalE [Succinivibrionaceae bacterium]|nr:UDP-glucose 4-epimerase GalE [Succinivibrionaceae bacterium]
MTRILVTGGCGYIGSHTVVELLNGNYEVTILDNLYNSKLSVLDRIQQITGKRPDFIEADIRDDKALEKVFSETSYDAVIHFAGLKAVGESCAKPLDYYDNNINGSVHLFKAMSAHAVKNIVFSSSATVYGTPSTPKIPETEPIKRGNSPYAQTKADIEMILEDWYNSDRSLSVCVLRYFNPVGAHSSGLMGEDPKGIPNNLMPYISQVAVGKRDHLNIWGNDYPTPDGTCIRDFIHVVDLARGHLAALAHCLNKPAFYTYNLGAGHGVSVQQVVDAYNGILEKPIKYVYGPRRPGDIAEYYADPAKAKAELGWQTELDINDIVSDANRWQTGNPDGYPD